jgi:hypothetical protein
MVNGKVSVWKRSIIQTLPHMAKTTTTTDKFQEFAALAVYHSATWRAGL